MEKYLYVILSQIQRESTLMLIGAYIVKGSLPFPFEVFQRLATSHAIPRSSAIFWCVVITFPLPDFCHNEGFHQKAR